MPLERMTARKVRISELMNGRWVKREGMEPSFIVTEAGEKVSRARIMGTVVAMFMAEDGNFGSVTVDDGTETIRAKTFKTTKPLDTLKAGDAIDLIGKVREYNGEVYIIPEVVTALANPNMELLRKAELIAKSRELSGKPPEAQAGEAEEKEHDPELRKLILEFISSRPDGVEYGAILDHAKAPETRVESVLNEVLAEGICYEPTPGKIKKI